MTGKIARIVSDKGFGFIHSNGTDYFFHKSECELDFHRIYGGEEVSFEPNINSSKGPRANNVKLIGRE